MKNYPYPLLPFSCYPGLFAAAGTALFSRRPSALSGWGRGFAVLGLLLFLAGSSALTAQITVDNTTTTTSVGVTALITLNHLTGTGYARLMLVGISVEQDGAGTALITSVTYGAGITQQTLTKLQGAGPNGEAEAQIWYLVAPQSGTHQIRLNISGSDVDDAFVTGVTTFTGVNQTTPLGTAFTSSDGVSPSTISVTGVLTGELVFGVIAHDDARPITSSGAGGQTGLWDVSASQGAGDGITGGGATKSGTGTVQLSWTLDDIDDGTSMVAVAIKRLICPSPNCGTVTLVKNP